MRTIVRGLLLGLLFILVMLTGALVLSGADRKPTTSAGWHAYAEGVLFNELKASFNFYAYNHPVDPEGKEWQHTQKLNVGDKRNFDDVCRKFDAWRDAMQKAGY